MILHTQAVNSPLSGIGDNPGQAMLLYPWEPITSIRVLPFNYEIPAVPANNFSITACRGEFEPGSFILHAQKDLRGIEIDVPDLYDVQGNSIPADAISVRLVKVWYQASENDIRYIAPKKILTPELLLNDDTLVTVDYVNQTNYLKVTINGVEQYLDISDPQGTLPADALIHDADSLQPFSLKDQENKQIWLTVHVPDDTSAGDYFGDITISAPSEVPVKMNFSVRVLPFDLSPAPLDYGLYYYGRLTGTPSYQYAKDAIQYARELQDMKDHGVVYPTLFQEDDEYLDAALALRDMAALPKDKIFLVGVSPGHDAYIGNATDPVGLAAIADRVKEWRNHTRAYGYITTYFYGMDEEKGEILLSQRPAWEIVHANGGKLFVAGKGSELLKMGDILDTAVVGQTLNAGQADLWHRYGHTILSYGNPQAGIENPELYRKNYGFALFNAGYDGAMDFAYQYRYGQSVWNDYDDTKEPLFRDHVFAYPVSDGVIDTIQWEGWREGVDDTRYAASLRDHEGNTSSAKALVAAGLSRNEDMTTIRERLIEQLLSSPANKAPELAVIGNKTVNAGSLLSFTVSVTGPDRTGLVYSVDSLPANAVFDPTTGTFSWTPTSLQAGTFNLIFRVTDGSSSDTEPVWITVTGVEKSPVCVTLESIGAYIPEYPAAVVPLAIVALFGLVVYAIRFRKG